MGMNLNYEILYQLQLLREALGNTGEIVMNAISEYSNIVFIPMVFLFYWCIDKKKGQTACLTYAGTYVLNHILKLTFCIERPWVVDRRIYPSKIAVAHQGGYSFPSGHVAVAASTLGPILICLKKRTLSILGWLFIAIIGFSRCYLGVHTPLDVIAGCAEAIAAALITEKICSAYWNRQEKINQFLIACIVFGIAAALYIAWKPYPVHIDESGNIVSDGKTMITYTGAALFLGTAIGIWFENRFVRFSTAIHTRQRVNRALFGLVCYIPLYLLKDFLSAVVISGDLAGSISSFALGLFGMGILPAAFPYLDRIGSKHEAAN